MAIKAVQYVCHQKDGPLPESRTATPPTPRSAFNVMMAAYNNIIIIIQTYKALSI